ncbi:MAG: hypothetical protein AMJ90_08915 [candidate division Zixibacteria bacterium SM23_73_2]|nr:MAG: hypothetical protein AMJ90_08915 [candidate division Zixibacteria bacterium SM23_73_2]
MRSLYIKEKIKFTGEQLVPFWTFERFDLLGDSIVVFIGPCELQERYVIGIDHWKKKTEIKSESMLHFLVEHFDLDLEKAILRQKILVNILKDKLNHRLGGDVFQRWGDDIYDEDYKLTISTAARTDVSTKIHLGINITAKNAPVKAKGLSDYGIDPDDIAQVVMNQYRLDMRRIQERLVKTRKIT